MGNMEFRIKEEENARIVYLEGKLDVFLSIEAEKEFNRLVDAGALNIIVNMKDLEFLSSSGLRTFIALQKKLSTLKGRLLFCSMPPAVIKIFQIVELTDIFCICETEQAALELCQEATAKRQ